MCNNNATVLTFGVYDMLHIGHMLLFKHAKELGNKLIVAVQDGVALVQVACHESLLEPFHALSRSSVVESFRLGVSTCFFLQVIVANDLCTLDSFFDVAVFERAEASVVVVGPDTGEKVCEQFQTHAEMVGLSLVYLVHLCVDLVENAQLVFHMMAYLVCNHVCVREISVSAQLAFHLGEER